MTIDAYRKTMMRGLVAGQSALFNGAHYRVMNIGHNGWTMLYNGNPPPGARGNKTVSRRAAIRAAIAWRRAHS